MEYVDVSQIINLKTNEMDSKEKKYNVVEKYKWSEVEKKIINKLI